VASFIDLIVVNGAGYFISFGIGTGTGTTKGS